MDFKGIPVTEILIAVVGIITFLLQRVQAKIASAETQKNAYVRLGVIAFAMVGDLWDALSTEFRLRVADGEIDAADKAAFRALISAKIEKYTGKEELEKLAVAAGLPMPGIIAWITEYAIDRLTKAHDPSTPSVSAKAYPVGDETPAAVLVSSPENGGTGTHGG